MHLTAQVETKVDINMKYMYQQTEGKLESLIMPC